MPHVTANGIDLFYDEAGPGDAPTILLIMGFGAQMLLWPDEFVAALVARGYRVIRFDNRDVGLSHKFDGVRAPGFVKLSMLARLGFKPKVPYRLADMADDAIGLLDALGIERAHIVGASMGGMIAQHVAARYPDRVLSLTCVFSTTGNPKLPPARRDALQVLIARPKTTDEAVLADHGVKVSRTIGSPAYPAAEEQLRDRAQALVRRSYYPEGAGRQLAAIVADGDRRALCRTIAAPTLVLHGEDDPLIPVAAGHDLAQCITRARLITLPGWGHDLPAELTPTIADAIDSHARDAVVTAR